MLVVQTYPNFLYVSLGNLTSVSYLDKYLTTANRTIILDRIGVIEAIGTYMGTMNNETSHNSYSMIGYIAIIFLCWLETINTQWNNNRCGFEFKYVQHELPERINPMLNEDVENEKEANQKAESEKWIKYKLLLMVCLKTIFEHAIISAFLFCAILKNNILEIAYVPVSFLCLILGLSRTMSLTFSYYSFFLLILQYFLCLANITAESAPQPVENVYFLRAFHLQKWPFYEYLLQGWSQKEEWATYFGLGNTPNTRIYFIYDAIVLFFQFLYFQHFCHPFYCLNKKDVGERRFSIGSVKSESLGEETENGFLRLAKGFYDFIKRVAFAYSHILTLFVMMFVNILSDGLIASGYLIFGITFIQLDLISHIGEKDWLLPLYLQYALKPYVFVDLLAQFIFQIPYFKLKEILIMKYIGIEDIGAHPYSALIKVIIYVIIIYQCSIYSSHQYSSICRGEKLKLKKYVRKFVLTY